MARLVADNHVAQAEVATMLAEYYSGVVSELIRSHGWTEERVKEVLSNPEVTMFVDGAFRSEKPVSMVAMGVVSVEDNLLMC
jgi:hypothetical protein